MRGCRSPRSEPLLAHPPVQPSPAPQAKPPVWGHQGQLGAKPPGCAAAGHTGSQRRAANPWGLGKVLWEESIPSAASVKGASETAGGRRGGRSQRLLRPLAVPCAHSEGPTTANLRAARANGLEGDRSHCFGASMGGPPLLSAVGQESVTPTRTLESRAWQFYPPHPSQLSMNKRQTN